MKVLVTGGAGFIGRHLVTALLDRGHDVAVVDNFSYGRKELDPRAVWHGENIRYRYQWGSELDGVDVIYHLAAIPNVARSWQKPEAVHNVNATGTLGVLMNALDWGVRKVVYASSSSVYGDTEILPKQESMTTKPLSPYAVSKLTGENYCNVFRQNGLETVILRYFNVYGPGQSPDSSAVIPSFIKGLRSKGKIIIYGDGHQSRDFTYVKDVVQATILAGESSKQGIYNVGAGLRYSLHELLDILYREIGELADIEYKDWRKGDVKDSFADITRARVLLGYEPEWNLSTGIKDMLNNG